MPKTFAIADLHGRADLLEMALTEIEKHGGGTVVFLGDYIDRGPDSKGVLECLRKGPPTPWWRWYCLTGNHEQFLVDCCIRGAGDVGLWMMNGGNTTLMSYGQKVGEMPDPSRVTVEHQMFVSKLLHYYEDDHRIYAHAGINSRNPPADESLSVFTWRRYDKDEDADHISGKHIVHGHEQYEDGPLVLPGRTDLDTLAWYTGRLVVGVFDDDTPGSFVDTIEIQGRDIKAIRAGY